MSKYDLHQLVTLWQKEKITAEQAIGQLLLHFQALAVRIGAIEKYVENNRKGAVTVHKPMSKTGERHE